MSKTLTARDIMNPEVITVREDMTVRELAALLTDQEISGVPVEDRTGRLVGVVSLSDIARVAADGGDRVVNATEHHFFVRGWEESFSPDELEDLHLEHQGLEVRDIMTPSVFAVEAASPIGQIAQSMMDSHLHRMLVVEKDRVVGIISTSDMLALLAED